MQTPPRLYKTLIVDDSPFMRKMLRTMLEANGCDVVAEATDGDEAIAEFARTRPDMVFMDIIMPNKSGIEATKGILSIDEQARVIMCSSIGHEDLIKAAMESGAKAVVFKPYKVSQIQEVMQTCSRLF